MSLDDSTEAFIGKTLIVEPHHGYGWTAARAEGDAVAHDAVPAPELFVVRVTRFWGFEGDSRRGGVGHVESPNHVLDGLWLVFSTRHEGVYNFTDRIGVYNTDLSSVEPTAERNGWPHYPAESRPARTYQGWAEIRAPGVGTASERRRAKLQTREEPLTDFERSELKRYQLTARWTGDRELRDDITADLESNSATVHRIRVKDAVVFAKRDDEGPVTFVLSETGATLAFTGQIVADEVSRGFPWREFEIRVATHSHLFLGLERLGDPFRAESRPSLTNERARALRLEVVSQWALLEIPFERVRERGS